MLRASKLHKRYGEKTALRSLDLHIEPGEIYALLGPNGAGKTTTIRCFLGFLIPDAGTAEIDGIDCSRDPQAARRRLAYIPEQVSLYDSLSGLENLEYFTSLAGESLRESRLRDVLLQAGLQADAHQARASTYSKGMRQKVGIAIAMARRVQALLLDEPTSGLDPAAAVEFSRIVRQLAGGGVAVLMATHDLFRAAEIAARIGVMQAGELIWERSGADVQSTELEHHYLRAIGHGGEHDRHHHAP
jgi:ABC-2 type transport system ATP-binding protein